jgi:hypothetical protein
MKDLENTIIEIGKPFFHRNSLIYLSQELREMEINLLNITSHYIAVVQEKNIVKLEISILTNNAIIDIVLRESVIVVCTLLLEKVGFIREERVYDEYSVTILQSNDNQYLVYKTYNANDTASLKAHIKKIKNRLYQ